MTAAAETSQTFSRGLDVLALVARSAGGLTVGELADELDLNRTIVYRLVATLAAHGLARRQDDGTIGVGTGVLALGANVLPTLRDAARDVLARLAGDAAATAHLSIVDGDESLAISVVEPPRSSYHLTYRVGTRIPLSRGAHCRALLAARRGRWDVVAGRGEVIPGAHGMAAAVPDLVGIEAAVGVIAPGPFDQPIVAALVAGAAADLAGRL